MNQLFLCFIKKGRIVDIPSSFHHRLYFVYVLSAAAPTSSCSEFNLSTYIYVHQIKVSELLDIGYYLGDSYKRLMN